MTSPEIKKQKDIKNGCIGCLGISVILVLGMGACGVLFAPKEQTAKEKEDEWYSKIADNTCERVLKKEMAHPVWNKLNQMGGRPPEGIDTVMPDRSI